VRSAPIDEPRRILVRLPNWVGDVAMATPALRALRRAHPRAEIVVEGRGHLAGLLRGQPSIDRFLPAPTRGLAALLSHVRAIARERFDWAVLLPDSPRTAIPVWMARIPVRAGYARDPLRRALLTVPVAVPADEAGRRVPLSMIERYLRLSRALGCADAGQELELAVDEAARDAMASRLAREGGAAGARYAVVTPGASFGASKLWPALHFAEACDRLERELGLRCVLAPGPGEEPVARAIAQAAKGRPICLADPVTTLAELSALVAGAALVLTNDTGPRHLAVAFDVPVVTVMGPTDPRHTAHLLERQRVLREDVPCSPCHEKVCPIDHRCMTRLSPSRVIDAARELLA
jgi:heptosyltransferase-2